MVAQLMLSLQHTAPGVCVIPASSCCRHPWPWWKEPSARSCWTVPCRRGCVSLQLPLGTFSGNMDIGHSPDWGPRVGEEEEEHLYSLERDQNHNLRASVGHRHVRIESI